MDFSSGTRPGAWGGYSVRRSGRSAEVAIGSPWCRFVRCVSLAGLPGDGFDEAYTDEESEAERENDGPGVGGEAGFVGRGG